MAHILLVDDDASLREVLSFVLEEQGHHVEGYADGAAALEALPHSGAELVITDLKMPGVDGREVLRRVREHDSSIPVIILTAFGSIDDAVRAMREGAQHYLTKPYNREELRLAVEQALDRRRLLLENRTLRDRLKEQGRKVEVVSASLVMGQILEMVRRIAPTDATVLLTGESGTGKEVLAQALHAYSDRWEGPFVAINCAAIPRDLMESELFGYAKGAFTGAVRDKPGKFQRASGGTLFLDEIADLPAELQSKLLRVLETRQVDVVGGAKPIDVDVRIVAATNADLAARVRAKGFRSDLFYRLNVIPIQIPPLRERPDDIPALWESFVRRFSGGREIRSTPELMRALMKRTWAGNVRELANVCQRMVLLRPGDVLDAAHIPPESEAGAHPSGEATAATSGEATAATGSVGQLSAAGTHSGAQPAPPAEADQSNAESSARQSARSFLGELPQDRLSLPEVEREIIVRALAKHGGNQTRAAEYLGIPRHVLLYRLEKFGI